MENTRQAGQLTQYGIPLILQPVPKKFTFDMDPEINIPAWIRLVDLDPFYWHERAIGKIASRVGVPIGADFRSLQKESMDWPWVQVIIDASCHPYEVVNIMTYEGEEKQQKIEYEYIPKFCFICKMFGHYKDNCPGPSVRTKIPTQQMHDRYRSRSRMGREHAAKPRSLSQGKQAVQPHNGVKNAPENRKATDGRIL